MSTPDIICIEYKNKMYTFSQSGNENPRMFYDRCMFKVKNMDLFSSIELEALSHVFIHKQYLGVEYDMKVEELLSKNRGIFV